MINLLMLLGLLLLVAGVLAFMFPEQAWRDMMPRGSRRANQASTSGLLIFSGLGWLGLMLLLANCVALWMGWRSERWTVVTGTVVESRLVEMRQVRSTSPAYRAHVVYRYWADGREQVGDRLDFADSSTVGREWVEEQLRTRYPSGAAVTVFVDPSDGLRSVLEPGVPDKAVILGFVGLAFVAIGAWQLRALRPDWEGDGLVKSKPRRRKHGKIR